MKKNLVLLFQSFGYTFVLIMGYWIGFTDGKSVDLNFWQALIQYRGWWFLLALFLYFAAFLFVNRKYE